MTKSQKRKAIRDNNILEMFALGFSREKIAEALDISFSTVKRLLEKYQVITFFSLRTHHSTCMGGGQEVTP